jgi:hypothetical protein
LREFIAASALGGGYEFLKAKNIKERDGMLSEVNFLHRQVRAI